MLFLIQKLHVMHVSNIVKYVGVFQALRQQLLILIESKIIQWYYDTTPNM
ncbi:MAG: hypothetical protein Sylvanvirus7_6 [Sylvanvirus sp.]|uniref:Uncharacterized protein n=1 Tax=Sylvanvirus sp. TaxID=2487774 RepID=A0A3G5AHS5_9VIRU|nr:MAG: hypothetical protein Sylvanvirus7_6 [Sylvanvirus sp.]